VKPVAVYSQVDCKGLWAEAFLGGSLQEEASPLVVAAPLLGVERVLRLVGRAVDC